MYPILGTVKYYSGTSGTVALGASEKVVQIWAVGGSGGKLTINGGSDITLAAGVVFNTEMNSGTVEWTGVSIVFTSTTSYFVKVIG